MKRILFLLAVLLTFNSCQSQTNNPQKTVNGSVRQPVFAGQFYSADSAMLTNQVKTFLKNAEPRQVNNVIAVIVPHAGYIYSGQIDADAYNQVKGNDYDLIVILGTNHTTAGFKGISVYPEGAFGTPIGKLEIDDKIAAELLKKDKDITADLSVHKQEHSIEVQIPFIKYLFPKVKILPIIVGKPDIDMCTRFGKALSGVLRGKKVLIVASSDLSHYPHFDDAIKVDNKTLKTIAGLNPKEIVSVMQSQMERNIPQLVTCACGEAPIIAAVITAKELGANSALIISYSNSGYNPTGSPDRVVGYGAVAIVKGEASPIVDVDTVVTDNSYVLTSSDKKALLKYARETLDEYFAARVVPLPRNINTMLKMKRGVFVTLKKHGDLRGCIGHMIEDTPLCTIVGSMALQAAFNDTRFSQLTRKELPQVEIEISVLTPFTRVDNADAIVMGRDGVIVKKGGRQAVFLPQVASETGWSKEVFLDQLCYKAGLSAGDWKDAELFTFQADVFSESDFR
jgi:AmmeMemoRadiSam system protein B/AmmeMemoRadiSam system protein A